MATAIASLLGLFLVTLSITYLISFVSAAVTRRQFAQSVSVLGTTGVDIVLGYTVNGELSSQFSSQTQQLTSQLLKMTQQHLAYPVLHFFHASSSTASAPLAVAALDDALVLLDSGVDSSGSPAHDVLGPLQRAIEHYPAPSTPPEPTATTARRHCRRWNHSPGLADLRSSRAGTSSAAASTPSAAQRCTASSAQTRDSGQPPPPDEAPATSLGR